MARGDNGGEALGFDDPEALPIFTAETTAKVGSNQFTTKGVDNINKLPRPTGTSRAYTVGRLKRDHPELADRPQKGVGCPLEGPPIRFRRQGLWGVPSEAKICPCTRFKHQGWCALARTDTGAAPPQSPHQAPGEWLVHEVHETDRLITVLQDRGVNRR